MLSAGRKVAVEVQVELDPIDECSAHAHQCPPHGEIRLKVSLTGSSSAPSVTGRRDLGYQDGRRVAISSDSVSIGFRGWARPNGELSVGISYHTERKTINAICMMSAVAGGTTGLRLEMRQEIRSGQASRDIVRFVCNRMPN